MSRPTTCRQPAYDAVFTLIRSLPDGDIARNGVIWQAVTSALDAANVPDCRTAGHDSGSHIDETGPNTEYRNFSRGIPGELPPRWIATELLDDAEPPFDFSSILGDYQRYADETDPHAVAVEGFTVAADVPAALRGPNCPRPEEDPAPLRKLAEQALAEGSPLPRVRPFAEIMADVDRACSDGLVPDPEPPTPVGLYETVMRMFGGPLPQDRPPLCPCGAQRFAGKIVHASDCPIHPVRLRAVEAAVTATLPPEARATGLHFAYDTTPLPPMIRVLADGEDPEEPFAIPSHVLGIYQAHAEDAQAHAEAVEAAIAKSTCTATLQRVGDINRRCTEQIHPGDYHHDDTRSWHDTDPGATPHVDATDQCRAEYHQPNWPSGHCDRPAGHPDNHRDQTISASYQWRDDHAVYPAEPTTED